MNNTKHKIINEAILNDDKRVINQWILDNSEWSKSINPYTNDYCLEFNKEPHISIRYASFPNFSICQQAGISRRIARWILEYQLCRPLEEGKQTSHLCENKRCVRSEHIVEMTQSENRQYSLQNGLNMGTPKGTKNYNQEQKDYIWELKENGFSTSDIRDMINIKYDINKKYKDIEQFFVDQNRKARKLASETLDS